MQRGALARKLEGQCVAIDLQADKLAIDATGTLAQDAITGPLLQKLGLGGRPRLARATYEDRSWDVAVPLVQAGGISARRLARTLLSAQPAPRDAAT